MDLFQPSPIEALSPNPRTGIRYGGAAPCRRIALIIPARNEVASIPKVLRAVPPLVNRVIVVDNGSIDGTGRVAHAMGGEVVREDRLGYGRACLSGIERLRSDPPAIVAFADGDGSDNPADLTALLTPILQDGVEFVSAHRIPQSRAALSLPQRLGNGLITAVIGGIWGPYFRDFGPMRAIRWEALGKLDMRDRNYGWTVEMQIKAIRHRLRIREIPLPYFPRAGGKSKVSRTFGGVIAAGVKMVWTVVREAWRDDDIWRNPATRRNGTAM